MLMSYLMDIFSGISGELVSLLRSIGSFAESSGGGRAYLAGELPRAMLTGEKTNDIEICVAGNLMFLADNYAKSYSAKIKKDPQGKECLLNSPYSQKSIKLTQARDGDIKKELFSRDFSIDGFAVELSRDRFGEILDPAGAMADLNSRVLRIMRRDVFKNPVSIYRAIRLIYKYNLSMDPITEMLMNQAIGSDVLKNVPSGGISIELALIKKEKRSREIMQALRDLKVVVK